MKEETENGSAMCGGVISDSLFNSNPWAYMMCYTMPDDKFKQYAELKNAGKDKEASKLFDKYAYSHI